MIDWSTCAAVERDPDRVSGAWVFKGTRVPVAALFENLEDGALASQFVDWFPGGTPVPLRNLLPQHSVVTAFELGWSILQNGELLDAAERENFDALVTTDSNL